MNIVKEQPRDADTRIHDDRQFQKALEFVSNYLQNKYPISFGKTTDNDEFRKHPPVTNLAEMLVDYSKRPVQMKDLQPLGDRVIIRPDPVGDKSAGGIIIPDTAKVSKSGVVLAIGPGRYDKGQLNPTYLKPGDRVLFNAYSGTELPIGEETILIMREDDIFSRV